MIRALLFDFDGTLYDPYLYFFSAFKKIADYLSEKLNENSEDIQARLWDILKIKRSTYPLLFDDLLKLYGIRDKNLVKKLVDIFYISPVDNLRLYPDAKEFIENVRGYKTGIITKGSEKKQIRAIKSLKLPLMVDVIIYAEDLGYTKLDPRLYLFAVDKLQLKPEECIYIGDNPYFDFKGANETGIHTVRLLRGEFKECTVEDGDAHTKIENFYEILDIIKKINST